MTDPASPDPIDQSPDALLRLVADSVPALLAYYHGDTLTCLFANRRYAEYNGWRVEDVRGRTVREIIGEAAWHTIEPHVRRALSGEQVNYVREQHLPDGEVRMIDVSLIPHFGAAGRLVGAFVLINDITDRWRAEQAVRESELRMRRFSAVTDEGIVFHRNGVITDVNGALLRMSGYTAAEMIGESITRFVPEDHLPDVYERLRTLDETPYESALLCRDGRELPVEYAPKSLPYAGDVHRVVVVRDIAARKQAQQRIEFLALHDPLTQLPNRQFLNEFLPKALAQARRRQAAVGLLFIDLDSFKPINDNHGHHIGDQVLVEVARRLSGRARASDLVVRLAGDEFLVVLCGIQSLDDAALVARALLEDLQAPVVVDGRPLHVVASIGVALFPEQATDPDGLLTAADSAMYAAKALGGNRIGVFGAA